MKYKRRRYNLRRTKNVKYHIRPSQRASATVTACAAGSQSDGTREGRDPISPSRRGGGRPNKEETKVKRLSVSLNT